MARVREDPLPPALSERSPDYIRLSLPLLWPLIAAWFRPDIRGLDQIPARGPVLLVGNHSGGNVVPDTIAFTLGFYRRFGVERPFFQLAHHLVMVAPPLYLLRKYGTIEASFGSARAALDRGAAVLVYPGGDWETHRPSWHGHRIEFAGREGFVRLALDAGVPIVPVVSIGGQETALFLTRGERVARALTIDRRLRLKVLPISLALPWGLDIGDFLGHIALPAKITIQVLEPIRLHERFGTNPDVDEVYETITALMQRTLDDLASERRWPVIG
ncbi:MAG TPA: 1-acyl-sn-glycerol-3-phosphate acyltransferase [Solirubrobacteraceae bacterium]|nr:1-acyl-sn-glycerol-3-phosphate acyltransferase [Solirubrobacteraceae bacterium]